MVSARIKKTVLVTAIALMGFTSAVQGADMGKRMNEMFNSLSNTTAPGAFETSARGVVTAGGLVVRNQISSVQFASMRAPSLEMGCGGIDFFGGSFSFISADQLVEFLKNVASNAVGYAFKMALHNVCPVCEVIMADLQNLANAVNNMNANSCQLAQGIVTGAFDSIADKSLKTFTDIGAAAKGLADDVASAFNKTSGESGSTMASKDDTNTVREKVEINFAYKAGLDAGAASIFQSSGEAESAKLEYLMSLTDSAIQRLPTKEELNADPNAQPKVDPLPATLSFKDFIEGTYGKSGTDSKALVVKVYTCDTKEKCLFPTSNDTSAYKGLADLIVEKLTTPGSDTNLPHIYRNAESTLSDEQKAVISFVGGKAGAYIRSLAQVDEGTATQFILDAAPIIAAQIAFDNGKRVFDEVQTSLRKLDTDLNAQPAKDEMAKSWSNFQQGYRNYIANYGGIEKLSSLYNALMETAKSSNAINNDLGIGKK